ncbi:MAG: hypothetical protein Q8P01_03080 [bacterium]|nr:hypothetical protein [bacterium]
MDLPYFADPVLTVQLCERVIGDMLPECADIIYLYGHAPANEKDVLDEGARVIGMYPNASPCLCGLTKAELKPTDPFSGVEAWTETLVKKAWILNDLIRWIRQDLNPVPVPCTDTESFNLLRYAKRGNNIKTIVIVTPVFHALRATISIVSAAAYLKADDLHIFVRAVRQDMDEVVQNTQSTAPAARIAEALSEMQKIQACALDGGREDRFKYLLPADAILAYFEKRGSL